MRTSILLPSLLVAIVACRGLVACGAPAEPEEEVEVVVLRYAEAAALADVLRQAHAGQQLRISADPRTNSLLLMGDPDRVRGAREAIVGLDVEVVPGGDR